MPAQRFTLRDFDFELPAQLIAQHPCAQRSASRLLDGRGQPLVDRIFHQLPDLLQSGDLLVFNDTQVVKARVFGEKASGGKLELLIERVLPGGHEVVAHMKVSKKPLPGARLHLCGGLNNGGFDATLLGRWLAGAQCRAAAATTPMRPKMASATKPFLPASPAQWPRPPPPCTLMRACWPPSRPKGWRRPASPCTWAQAPFSP